MLSLWEMDDMRATFVAACDKQCVISTPGEATDGPGGQIPGVPTTISRLCRVMDLTGSEREVGGRLSGIADVMILLDYEQADIRLDASVTVDGDTYAIVRTAVDSTQPVATRVYGQRIT